MVAFIHPSKNAHVKQELDEWRNEWKKQMKTWKISTGRYNSNGLGQRLACEVRGFEPVTPRFVILSLKGGGVVGPKQGLTSRRCCWLQILHSSPNINSTQCLSCNWKTRLFWKLALPSESESEGSMFGLALLRNLGEHLSRFAKEKKNSKWRACRDAKVSTKSVRRNTNTSLEWFYAAEIIFLTIVICAPMFPGNPFGVILPQCWSISLFTKDTCDWRVLVQDHSWDCHCGQLFCNLRRGSLHSSFNKLDCEWVSEMRRLWSDLGLIKTYCLSYCHLGCNVHQWLSTSVEGGGDQQPFHTENTLRARGYFLLVPKGHFCVLGFKLNWFRKIIDRHKDFWGPLDQLSNN